MHDSLVISRVESGYTEVFENPKCKIYSKTGDKIMLKVQSISLANFSSFILDNSMTIQI